MEAFKRALRSFKRVGVRKMAEIAWGGHSVNVSVKEQARVDGTWRKVQGAIKEKDKIVQMA